MTNVAAEEFSLNVNILNKDKHEEENISTISSPTRIYGSVTTFVQSVAIHTYLPWNGVSVKMIMRLSPGFLWQPVFAS